MWSKVCRPERSQEKQKCKRTGSQKKSAEDVFFVMKLFARPTAKLIVWSVRVKQSRFSAEGVPRPQSFLINVDPPPCTDFLEARHPLGLTSPFGGSHHQVHPSEMEILCSKTFVSAFGKNEHLLFCDGHVASWARVFSGLCSCSFHFLCVSGWCKPLNYHRQKIFKVAINIENATCHVQLSPGDQSACLRFSWPVSSQTFPGPLLSTE